MSKVYLIAFYLCLHQLAYSQHGLGQVRGEVIDTTSSIYLYGNVKSVILKGTTYQAQIDTLNKFILPVCPKGTYELCVIMYNTYSPSAIYTDTICISIEVENDRVHRETINVGSRCPYNQVDKICPYCHSNADAIPVIYNKRNKRINRRARKGKISIGGYNESECKPKWHCKLDRSSF